MGGSLHLRGLVIAGALAALALALGFVTLAMNQTASKAAPHVILPLKDRPHPAGSATGTHKLPSTAKPKKKVAVKRPDPNLVAALRAGLPRPVAEALAKRPVVVVELASSRDPVGKLASGEAQAGAALAGAAFVGVDIDRDGGSAGLLTTVLGKLPAAPAALVYTRPAALALTMTGFNDRTAVQQAAATATPQRDSSASLASASWATKANAICSATYAKVGAMGGASKLSAAQGQSIYGGMYKQVAALAPPAGSAPAVRSANALLERSIGLLGQAHVKQAAGKVAMPIYRHANTVMAQWSAKYDQLGASACTSTT